MEGRKLLIFASVFAAGCVRDVRPQHVDPYYAPKRSVEVIAEENKIPGTVTGVWAEQMFDSIQMPGQLDPTQTYYRPPHRSVVEIRPDRYQDVKY